MWNSGQPQQTWGWPPNVNYHYNQGVDESQGWAAAAALWAHQKQIQEQYKNDNTSSPKPPEPPGPPPVRPPLPAEGIGGGSIEVHDYMHGQTSEQPTEVVDYQHGNIGDGQPAQDVFDYNHGKQEDFQQDENWNNGYWQQHQQNAMENFNNEWHPEQWNHEHWSNQHLISHCSNEIHQAPPPPQQGCEQEKYEHAETERNEQKKFHHNLHPSGFHNSSDQHNDKPNKHGVSPYHAPMHAISFQNNSGRNSPDPVEVAKKAKSLPLWLRQGLEKMEKDKKKSTGENKEKKDLPNSKKISGYQHGSPMSSPERRQESDSEETESLQKSHGRHISSPANKNKLSAVESADESSEEELDEEEKQRQLMLKIKTWMTEILLGVTNDEIKGVCTELYFEMKRSAKVKATQIRRSGGLEALRSAALGGDDEPSSSESEEEEEKQKTKPVPKTMYIERYSKQIENESNKRLFDKDKVKRLTLESDNVSQNNQRDDNIRTGTRVDVTSKPEETDKRDVPLNRVKNTVVNNTKRNRHSDDSSDDEAVNKFYNERRVVKEKEPLRGRNRESSEEERSTDTASSKESETGLSEESESDYDRHQKKLRKRHSRSGSRSPTRKIRKKSKRRTERSSSSDSERRKKKRRRERSSSLEDSEYVSRKKDSSYSHKKKASRGKKHKHKVRSVSRSPRRLKKRR